jgi:hypothetical protein
MQATYTVIRRNPLPADYFKKYKKKFELFKENKYLDKTWAADLYLIHKLEPKARVCISDTDRMRMFYRT